MTSNHGSPASNTNEDLCAIIALQRELIRGDLALGRFLQGVLEHLRRLCGADGAILELADGDQLVACATAALTSPGTRRNPARFCDDEVRSMGCVRVVSSGDIAVGVLRVLSARARAFSSADLEILHVVARVTAAAVVEMSAHTER